MKRHEWFLRVFLADNLQGGRIGGRLDHGPEPSIHPSDPDPGYPRAARGDPPDTQAAVPHLPDNPNHVKKKRPADEGAADEIVL